MKKLKKPLALVLVAITVLSLCVGAFAYFTDRVTGNVSATAGTLELKLSSFTASKTKDFKPGEAITLSYDLTNIGNKSADVREMIVITVTDSKGNAVSLNANSPEFALYKASDVTINASTGAFTIKGSPNTTVNGNKITYDGASDEFILNGNVNDAARETETGGKDKHDGEYVLVFSASAGNKFQNLTLTIDYEAQAKQHRNTGDSTWAVVKSETITFGGNSAHKSVPEK